MTNCTFCGYLFMEHFPHLKNVTYTAPPPPQLNYFETVKYKILFLFDIFGVGGGGGVQGYLKKF
jgi:hypothetical protein